MKTQVNSLKSSSFPKIISPKLFSNSFNSVTQEFLTTFEYRIHWNVNIGEKKVNSLRKNKC